MEFDKSKVYTALNADELKVGSKCIFADTVKRLSELVESDDMQEHVHVLIAVLDDDKAERFEIEHTTYSLAYLLKEPQYKPFSSTAKAMEVIQKHGGWIRNKEKDEICLVTGVTNSDFGIIVYLAGYYGINSTKLIHERFSFFDDGSPCGELAEV